MKKNHYVIAALVILALSTACKKDSGSSDDPGGTTTGNLVRIRQGVSVGDDTVYLIQYDGKNRISTLIDSIYQDTLTASYDDNSRLVAITEKSSWNSDHLTATYNGSGQLTQIDYTLFGLAQRYTFEYSGSMPGKCSFYDAANGPLALWQYFIYTSTGQNITGIKVYSNADVFMGEKKIAFGTKANPFKLLSLFNWANRLGTDAIITTETFFNANLPEKTDWYGDGGNIFFTTTVAGAYNSANAPTGIVATNTVSDGTIQDLYTWSFLYK